MRATVPGCRRPGAGAAPLPASSDDRDWLDPARLPHLSKADRTLRVKLEQAIEALVPSLPEEKRRQARQARVEATKLYLSEAAYTWFNRLMALRCLGGARAGSGQAIKVKPDYAGARSATTASFASTPSCARARTRGCGLLAPRLWPGGAGAAASLRPGVAAHPGGALGGWHAEVRPSSLGETVSLTAGPPTGRGAHGRGFGRPTCSAGCTSTGTRRRRTASTTSARRGKKLEARTSSKTCLYTEEYMVRFLVENSLGAIWRRCTRNPGCRRMAYFVRAAERRPRSPSRLPR